VVLEGHTVGGDGYTKLCTVWQLCCLPSLHEEYAATLSVDSSLQRQTVTVWNWRRAFHYLASVCCFALLLGYALFALYIETSRVLSIAAPEPASTSSASSSPTTLLFFIRFVLIPPSAKRTREGEDYDDPSVSEEERQPQKKARQSLLRAKRNLGTEAASTADSGSEAPIDIGEEDLEIGDITCPTETLLDLPAPPKEASAYTIKFVVPFPAEELKRRLTQILLPTKERTGFRVSMLDTLHLRNPNNNLWFWEFPRDNTHALTAYKLFCARELGSPLGNSHGVFAINGLKVPKFCTAAEEGLVEEASDMRVSRQPLLMCGPIAGADIQNLVKWLATVTEPGRERYAHVRAQYVGHTTGRAGIRYALVEAYSPDTHAWLCKADGKEFEEPIGEVKPPAKFTAVPWCKSPNSVILQGESFGRISQKGLEDWVHKIAERAKVEQPVSVVGITSPETGNPLKGVMLVFGSAAARAPWSPAPTDGEESGILVRSLAAMRPHPVTAMRSWGKIPKPNDVVKITSSYPHVNGVVVQNIQPVDQYARPNGPPEKKKRGSKKKATGKGQAKALTGVDKDARRKHAANRIQEKEDKERKGRGAAGASPSKTNKPGGRGRGARK